MKAVICAAGEGKRMRPYTDEMPKALLPIGEKTIIEYLLDNLSASGIRDVVVVVGYGALKVKEKVGSRYKNCSITYVLNEEYATTNNIYSLWLAREHITDGMIFFNGDIVFHQGILSCILSNTVSNSFAADPFSDLQDDAMKVVLRGGRMRKIGKHLAEDANAWAIGIYKLSQEASEAYFEEAGKLFEEGEKNVSFVVPLQAIAEKFPLLKHKVLPQYQWVEIDTPEDYENAKKKVFGIVGQIEGDGYLTFFSNYKELATSPLRKRVLGWADSGIRAALPEEFMHKRIRLESDTLYINNQYVPIKNKRVFIIGAGKASVAMAVELEKILGKERIYAGVVLSNDTVNIPEKIEVHHADHPIPTERSVQGADKILSFKEKYAIGVDDLIIALVSGGGSSLMARPVSDILLSDKQKTVEALIKSGGNVHEITVIKKKSSHIKGGKLAQHFFPTPILSLVLSDVVGNNLDVISSGPFAEDFSTFDDALRIISERGIEEAIPHNVLAFLEKNKGNDTRGEFGHVRHEVLADNATALENIRTLAEKEGITVVVESKVQGEARNVAYTLCSSIHRVPITKPTLFLFGGETTVTLDHPHKKGGRNQEFILAALQYLNIRPFSGKWCVASIGTDGIDFIEDSTGGIIDEDSLRLAKEKGLDVAISSFLEKHKTGR